jgi:hypothetical protein
LLATNPWRTVPVHHPTSSTSRATLSSKVTEPFCRLDWKLTLSLQFSWRTKKAGRRKNGFLLFKRNEKDQRIILINNSFKGQLDARIAARAQTPLFTFLNRKDISAAASFSWLEVLLRCRKQIPKDARIAPHAESSTGILTSFPFAKSRHLASACAPNPSLF